MHIDWLRRLGSTGREILYPAWFSPTRSTQHWIGSGLGWLDQGVGFAFAFVIFRWSELALDWRGYNFAPGGALAFALPSEGEVERIDVSAQRGEKNIASNQSKRT